MVCFETLNRETNFFDSLGRAPNQDIRRMIKGSGISRFNVNTRRLQKLGTADCASFVLFYLLMRCRNTDFVSVINQKFSSVNRQNHWAIPRLISALLSRRYFTQHCLDKTFFLSRVHSMTTAPTCQPQFGNYSPDKTSSPSGSRSKVPDRCLSRFVPNSRVADSIRHQYGETEEETSEAPSHKLSKTKKDAQQLTPRQKEQKGVQKAKKANRQKKIGQKKCTDKVRTADSKGSFCGLPESMKKNNGAKLGKNRKDGKKTAVGRNKSKELLLKIAQMNVGLLKMVLDNSYS